MRVYNTIIKGKLVSLKKDGNKWCCMHGKDLQEGEAGFGDSKKEAIENYHLGRRIEIPDHGVFGYLWTHF